MKLKHLYACAAAALVLAVCPLPLHADTIAWTAWSGAVVSIDGTHTPGSATGTVLSNAFGTITVTYSGQTSGLLTNYPSWNPVSTFTDTASGGIVGNAPPQANNAVQIEGGQTYTETITFSHEIVNPIFAIWSLGSGGTPAYFNFTTSNFNVLGGGPSAEYGGQAIVKPDPSSTFINGSEGNGIVQFNGTYTSLTFTTPNYEGYYSFTIGEDYTLTEKLPPTPTGPPSAVPEPATLSLFGMGLAALPILRRKLTHRT